MLFITLLYVSYFFLCNNYIKNFLYSQIVNFFPFYPDLAYILFWLCCAHEGLVYSLPREPFSLAGLSNNARRQQLFVDLLTFPYIYIITKNFEKINKPVKKLVNRFFVLVLRFPTPHPGASRFSVLLYTL